jgi:hypothetical protein
MANAYREIGWLLSFGYFMVRWHAGAISLPPDDVILARLARPFFVYIWIKCLSGKCFLTEWHKTDS